MANETVQYVSVEVKLRMRVTGSDGAALEKEHTYTRSFTDGTGTTQCGAAWNDDTRSLASTTETLDLDGLSDFKGATMSDNNAVKMLFIENLETTTGKKITIGGGDWAGTAMMLQDSTDKLRIGPGGLLLWVDPIDGGTVTASTGDGLLVDSGSNTVAYKTAIAFDNA